MEKICATIRCRMSEQDVYYCDHQVDTGRILQLFSDVGSELLIRLDGDEGLLKAYTSIDMKAPLFAGEYVEVYGEITAIGNTSRKIRLEARKVISPRPDISDSASEVLKEPVIICTAEGIGVTPLANQRYPLESGKPQKRDN